MKKPIEIINAKKEYLDELKDRVNSILEVFPLIDKVEDVTNWEQQAFSNLPEEAEEIPTNDLVENLQIEYDHLVSAFPLPPKYDPSFRGGTIAMTTSGSTIAYEFVGRVGDIGTPDATKYANLFIASFETLQLNQNREEEVRSFIQKFKNAGLSSRYENCIESISQYHLIIKGKKEPVANFIRNLLNGVSGQLFEIARKSPKENMTWEEMAKRLANSPIAVNIIIRQEKEQSNLLSRTADVLKDRDAGSITNIDNIWVQVLGHLYILANSLKI